MGRKKKEFEYEWDPIKEQKDGQKAQAVIWSTKILNAAVDGIKKGLPLKANPFIGKNTKLLKPDLVFRRTAEELDEYIKCKLDPVYFASKCYLMTPEGLQPVELRDYQVDYLRHLQKNRFSIFLSCRQSGKSFSYLATVKICLKNVSQNDEIKEKLFFFYIKDNIYDIPVFELYNVFCKQTLVWKLKYHLYKLIYKLTYGRKKGNDNKKES